MINLYQVNNKYEIKRMNYLFEIYTFTYILEKNYINHIMVL